MKKAIFTLALFFAAIAASAQDKYLTVVNLGNGVLEVTNLQNCAVDIELAYDGKMIKLTPNTKNHLKFTQIPKGKSHIQFTAVGLTYISVKALTICNWQGAMPVWVNVDLNTGTLPVKIVNLRSKLVTIK